MSIIKKNKDLLVSRMVELEEQIKEMNETYEMCTKDKITDFDTFDYEKYLIFFGVNIQVSNICEFFDNETNYMVLKDINGCPAIVVDFELEKELKEDGKNTWNTFLIKRFSEITVDRGKEFSKYPKGSIFIKGKTTAKNTKLIYHK